MSEAYLPSSSIAPSTAQSIQAGIPASGVRLSWQDEIYLLTPQPVDSIAGLAEHCSLSNWKNQPGLDTLLLRAACRQLLLGERRLIVLIQQVGLRFAAILLAGLQAVGIYNLTPMAQLQPGWILPATTQPLPAAAGVLKTAGVEPGQVHWVALQPIPSDWQDIFPTARPVPGRTHGAFFHLHSIAKDLTRKAPLAALLIAPTASPLRVVLVERV